MRIAKFRFRVALGSLLWLFPTINPAAAQACYFSALPSSLLESLEALVGQSRPAKRSGSTVACPGPACAVGVLLLLEHGAPFGQLTAVVVHDVSARSRRLVAGAAAGVRGIRTGQGIFP